MFLKVGRSIHPISLYHHISYLKGIRKVCSLAGFDDVMVDVYYLKRGFVKIDNFFYILLNKIHIFFSVRFWIACKNKL